MNPDLTWAKPYGTVVFDLDGILAETTWPRRHEIGTPIPEGVEMLTHYADEGFVIIIYTSRPHEDESLVWRWVNENDLPVDQIVCGKPLAALYVDDRAYRPEWVEEWHG